MRRRIVLGVAVALAVGTAGGLLVSRPGGNREEGVVRIVSAPPDDPAPAPAPLPTASPAPPGPARPADPSGSGVDPPAPREANSPNYADLGVLPAI